MKEGTVDTMEHRRALTAFIWWTAWAATTERAGESGKTLAPNGWRRQPEGHLHQQLAERTAGGQHATAGAVVVVGFQRAVPDRRHRRAGLAPRGEPRPRRGAACDPRQRSVRAAADHPVDARDREVLLGGAGAVPGADPARRDHRALPGRRPAGLRLRAVASGFPIRSRAPGIRSWRCCGSRWRGWAPACTSRRRCRDTSRSSSASASTSCS